MARVLLLLWFWMWGAGTAPAADAPAEVPPDGFAARQYVDSAGCVFLRSGAGWAVRRDSAGAPICGYPPTPMSLDKPGPLPAALADPAVSMPGMSEVEARLLAAVAGEMRPGEFAAAAGDSGPVPAPAPAATGNADPAPAATPSRPADLGRQIAIASVTGPVLDHTASAALHPNARLCALIGAGAPVGAARLGHDPTGGFCAGDLIALPRSAGAGAARAGGQAAADPPTRRAAAPHVAIGGGKPARDRQAVRMVRVPPKRELPGRRLADPRAASRTVVKAVTTIRPAGAGRPSPAATMIPAGARWLEVGRHADPLSAEASLRRLQAAGFPAARAAPQAGMTAVLAGPYPTRQAIVRAYDRLNAAGFGPLRPR